MISPMHKKLKSMPSAAKSMVTVFWDEEGVILGDLLLYLGICCYTWEFVVILGDFLLYLGISCYTWEFVVVLGNLSPKGKLLNPHLHHMYSIRKMSAL